MLNINILHELIYRSNIGEHLIHILLCFGGSPGQNATEFSSVNFPLGNKTLEKETMTKSQ